MLERGLKPATTLLDPKKPSEVGEKWRLVSLLSFLGGHGLTADYEATLSTRTPVPIRDSGC